MMVLIIIGLLVTLLSVAVNFALKAANRAALAAEVSNLDMAMQTYKSNYGGEYPPCMGIPLTPANNPSSPSCMDLFNRALRKHFPRYTGQYTDVYNLLMQGTAGNPPIPWKVHSISNPGNAITLDLTKLDAAEALVFWLAGPPTPLDINGNPYASTILYGFSASPTSPFQILGPTSRVASLFDFDQTRLTDVDGDGWPEYTPKGTSTKTIGMAPYVYFDYQSYAYTWQNGKPFFACYPHAFFTPQNATPALPIPQGPGAPAPWISEWGMALPYITGMTSSNPLVYTYWNPAKFQIIAAGADSDYGGSQYEPSPALGSSGGGRPFLPFVPQKASQGNPVLLQGDLDNVTNFINGQLEDYTPQ